MNFSVNQASHLYVVKQIQETPSNAGDIALVKTPHEDAIYFSYMGKGGLIRSDLIDIDKIMYASYTKAEDLRTPLRKIKVSLGTDIVAGQDYLLRIIIKQAYSMDEGSQMLKYGVVHAVKNMTPEDFYSKMVESLKLNFKRDITPTLDFEAAEDGIIIKELEQPWHLGTFAQKPLFFEVYTDFIVNDGEEVRWGATDENTGKDYVELASETSLANSKKIADLEWFCMGERGDQYKNYGWPNVIPTEYMVDPNNTDGYNVLNIHYSYVGSNESVQKSEKDIYIVSTTDLTNSLVIPLTNAGIKVKTKINQPA